MSFDKGRIQGFGSDGCTSKIWRCPAGHMLQPWTAQPGACDSCHAKVDKGDVVMDCRQCNWYLCKACHPHEQEQDDSWYGMFNSFVDAATHEVTEITQELHEMAQEAETYVTEMMDSVSCVPTNTDQFGRDEIDLSVNQEKAASSAPKGKGKGKYNGKGKDNGKGKKQEAPAASPDTVDEETAAGAKEGDAEADTEGAAAGVAEAPKPKHHEDLMDFGQHDLLDLDLQAPPAPAAAAAMDNLLDIDIMDPVTTWAKVGGASDELLDLSGAPGPTLLHTTGAGIPKIAPPAAPAISVA
mmetsp:Transcript_19509/g.51650  ORF Transcript_19509/g.51650 Transcript_19509/m.51650 type:complete len:297 (-) Transcript_19509:335-1225(-)